MNYLKYLVFKARSIFQAVTGTEKEEVRCERLLKIFNRNSIRGNEALRPLDSLIHHDGWFCITPPFYCEIGSNIYLGKGVYMNTGVVILDRGAKVIIGENTLIAPNVIITTAHHNVNTPKNRGIEFTSIVIGNHVWICAGAIILPGVTIGDCSVVAAGAIVKDSVPPNCLVAGNPATVKKYYLKKSRSQR